MIEIKNEMVSMFDVDETLVVTLPPEELELIDCNSVLWIKNPYDGSLQKRAIHLKHVELLRQMHGRGRMIGVWSGGGVEWAKNVVEALGLKNYVHLVMTKPICFVDDLPASQWLNNHIYLKP